MSYWFPIGAPVPTCDLQCHQNGHPQCQGWLTFQENAIPTSPDYAREVNWAALPDKEDTVLDLSNDKDKVKTVAKQHNVYVITSILKYYGIDLQVDN